MSKIYFISDLHLGHKRILQFAGQYRDGSNVEEHDDWIVKQWNSIVRKRDKVYVLGDVAFTPEGLARLSEMNGTKILIRGNHDEFPIKEYLKYFQEVYGLTSYKGFWLSHCPIHPVEIRGRKGNIHGHVHQNVLPDKRYFPVCVEQCRGVPISFEEIKSLYEKTSLEEVMDDPV